MRHPLLVTALWTCLSAACAVGSCAQPTAAYTATGIGGGGAMAGLSFSPYAPLWFVGTDMGTLFRSTDRGASWHAIAHDQVQFGARLPFASSVGFASDPRVVFFAENGSKIRRSVDGGISWTPIALPLASNEWLRYWRGDDRDPRRMFAATSLGLWQSRDGGTSWTRATAIAGESSGTFLTPSGAVFHAADGQLYRSDDDGRSFQPWWRLPSGRIRHFAAGSDARTTTLAILDDDGGHACAALRELKNVQPKALQTAQAECGYVWTMTVRGDVAAPHFVQTQQPGGRFLRMATADPRVIWTTGGDWPHQWGNRVSVSQDAGRTWTLQLQLLDWEHGYAPWPATKLQRSAVALDVGWHDNAYTSFAVDDHDARRAGATGFYFLHTTFDGGAHWQAPFTSPVRVGETEKARAWRSTGLEVTSIQRLKFHPRVTMLGYAAAADVGGLATEDGGATWRIIRTPFNTNYDYALDPDRPDRVWVAAGSPHDFPIGNRDILPGATGAILRSDDRGRTWTRLTLSDGPLPTAYLAVARRASDGALFGGTRGQGVVMSQDDGATWRSLNAGLPAGPLVVPQLEIDPQNGDLYALVTGNGPGFANAPQTGIYRWSRGAWQSLRGRVDAPAGVPPNRQLLHFPTAFAIDWSRPKRDLLWLVDFEVAGNWLGSGAWRSQDGGRIWTRALQFTHPTMVTLDPVHPQHVHVSGQYQVDGKWGNGGAYASADGGVTWQKNENLPLRANLDGVALDPNRPGQLFYLFFGGGMLRGPDPLK